MYKPNLNLKMESTAGSFNKQESNPPPQGDANIRDPSKPVYASKPTFAVRNRSIPLPSEE